MNKPARRRRPLLPSLGHPRVPRPRTVLRSVLATVLPALGLTVAAAPVYADTAGAPASGTACVFSSPTASGLGLGHVAWAVSDPATGGWIFGSADGGGTDDVSRRSGVASMGTGALSVVTAGSNTSGASVPVGLSVSASGTSSMSSASSTVSAAGGRPVTPGVPDYTPADAAPRVWMARTGAFSTVLHDFATFRWYQSYRCKDVTGVNAGNAYTTAANDTGFDIAADNCLAHVRTVLLAYQPQTIARFNVRALPNDWYDHLGDEGFGAPTPLPSS